MKVTVERQQNQQSRGGDGLYNIELKGLPWMLVQHLLRACGEHETLAELVKDLEKAVEAAP